MSANAKLISPLFQRYWIACLSSVRLIPSDALCFYCMSQCQASSSVWYMFTDQRADSSAIYRNTPLPITGCVGPKEHRERMQGNTPKRWKLFPHWCPWTSVRFWSQCGILPTICWRFVNGNAPVLFPLDPPSLPADWCTYRYVKEASEKSPLPSSEQGDKL